MPFFYSDVKSSDTRQSTINVWKMNGTSAYLRHYDNYLFLDFVSKNPLATAKERADARHELPICEKKLEFWRRHPKYDETEALRGVQELKRNWTAKAA